MNLDQRINARRMPREELEALHRLILQHERQMKRVQRRAEIQARAGLDFWSWAALDEAPEHHRRHFFEARAHSLAQAEVEQLHADIWQLRRAHRDALGRFAFQEACPCAFDLLLACVLGRHPNPDLLATIPQFTTVRGVAESARARTFERRALPERATATQSPVRMLLLREVGEVRGGAFHRFTFQDPAHPTR